jgi:N6-adenosine-specific RNA methylase IME4
METIKYKIIYADPPWKYKDKGCNGNAESHYTTLSLGEICAMPIHLLCDDNCILFLWATYPMLKEAFQVIESWGFDYKSIAFQWLKLNKKNGKPFFGLGRWTRGNTEPCLLAVKGKPKRISSSVFQLIQTPIEQHSKKPDIAREKIVDLCGDLPRLELFARKKVQGWHCCGDEIEKDLDIGIK